MHFPVTKGILLRHQIGAVQAVDEISFTVRSGETLGIVGESGCGKSTLARCIHSSPRADLGRIVFEGTDITHLSRRDLRPVRREMKIVFQDPQGSLNPRKRVRDIIGEPLEVQGIGTKRDRQWRVREMLEVVGLNPEHYNRFPHEFSGGQRQRIGIARALAVKPKLVICDEPVSALDVSVQAQVLNLLKDLQQEFGLTYIFIAHDLNVVRHISDRVMVMYLGKLAEIARSSDLYEAPKHPYTGALLSAIPIPTQSWDAVAGRSCSRGTYRARSIRRPVVVSTHAARASTQACATSKLRRRHASGSITLRPASTHFRNGPRRRTTSAWVESRLPPSSRENQARAERRNIGSHA